MTDTERAEIAFRLISEIDRSSSMLAVTVDSAILSVEDLVDVLKNPGATLDEICKLRGVGDVATS